MRPFQAFASHAAEGLHQPEDLDCGVGNGGANTSTEVVGPKCLRRWESYDSVRGACEPALRLGVRDCFDGGLDAATFTDLWANQSGSFLDTARTGWTPMQYDSCRVNLSRVINSHAHEPLFVNAASGVDSSADAKAGRGGAACTHLPGYARVFKTGYLDPVMAYLEQLGYVGASHNIDDLTDGVSARATINGEGSAARTLTLSLWQGRGCTNPLGINALGLTFELQFVAQVPFQDIVASSYAGGMGGSSALCLPYQVAIKSESPAGESLFTSIYAAGLFFSSIRPRGPTISLGWAAPGERFERKPPRIHCPAYIGLTESADGKFELGGELEDRARSGDGEHSITLPVLGACNSGNTDDDHATTKRSAARSAASCNVTASDNVRVTHIAISREGARSGVYTVYTGPSASNESAFASDYRGSITIKATNMARQSQIT